jgi:hypothetical protein
VPPFPNVASGLPRRSKRASAKRSRLSVIAWPTATKWSPGPGTRSEIASNPMPTRVIILPPDPKVVSSLPFAS